MSPRRFFFADGARLKKEAEFIRSLPAAVRCKHRGRVYWAIDGKRFRIVRRISSLSEVSGAGRYAIVVPHTVQRIVELKADSYGS